MRKTLISTLFFGVFLISPMALAQEESLSQMPSSVSAATAPPAGSSYIKGGAPINMRPRAYISHRPVAETTQPGRLSYPDASKSTSAQNYNRNLIKARLREQSLSGIPSPFPSGWGE